jgi:hypothetical protein
LDEGIMADIISEAKENYKTACEGWKDIYDSAREDLKFTYDVDSGQWPDNIKADRGNRPTITVNKLQKFVRQCRGDFSQNRPSMKVIPVDDKADVKMAELYNGILRQIEYTSNAPVIYDTAYSCSLAGSIGYFRISTEYTDDNSFDQEIKLKRILNPLSVHLDPFATEFNFEDAEYGFVEELLDNKLFERLYPKANKHEFKGEGNNLLGEWMLQDKIKICEYFKKEYFTTKIGLVSDGQIVKLDKKTIELINADGLKIIRERDVQEHRVKWYKINGAEILDETDWAGSGIPIIPMFGDEVVVDGKRYYLSLIRGAKGSQQMYNYWASAATENVMLTPKTPFIIDHRQIRGFESEWAEANLKPKMYLRYNAIAGINKPTREPQTQVPAAIIQMMQSTAYDIEDHLGRYEASKGAASNERSGKAIIARINQSDKGTFTFVDNASRAIIAGLRQIVDLIPKIYDTPRALNILGENGERGVAQVNQPAVGANGEPAIANDLTVGKFDVIATVGASFGSKREEMVRMLIESMQYAPMLAPVIAPLIFKYSDWPGAQEVAAKIEQAVVAQQQAAAGEQVQSQGVENIAHQQVMGQ